MLEQRAKKDNGNKRTKAIVGIAFVGLFLAAITISYPWLQLSLAKQLVRAERHAQAETILISLSAGKQQWTEVGYMLVECQLSQGKGREAVQTVLSLAGTEKIDDLELAIVFSNVADYLLGTGKYESALELARRVRTQGEGAMLGVAVKEISFLIASRSDLPLALDAINLAVVQGETNWQTNQKAFNLLLSKALEATPHLAEPALERALQLFPDNIIAITRKASLVGERNPKEALEYLRLKDLDLKGSFIPEYLAVKRALLLRLADSSPETDLSLYTDDMPYEMVVDIAGLGLDHAGLSSASGKQYYNLAPDEPQIAFQYGQNLVQLNRWESARAVFKHAEELDPGLVDFRAVFAALDSKTKTKKEQHASEEQIDAFKISPDGKWLAWRKWREYPMEQIMVSDLLLSDMTKTKAEPWPLGDVIEFKWSPDSKFLALQIMTPGGQGRLDVLSVADGNIVHSPAEYDVIDFNWAKERLFVQALHEHRTVLFQLQAPLWEAEAERDWDFTGGINPDGCWLTIDDQTLSVYKGQKKLNTYNLSDKLLLFSDWSPTGRLAIIEDMAGRSWIYNHQKNNVMPINVPGKFAAWAADGNFFWFLPVWDNLYTIARLDERGRVKAFFPYSFAYPYYDVSIAADGGILAFMEDDSLFIQKK